jgi:hypothetical protein
VALYSLWTRPQWDFLGRLTRFTGEHWAWDLVFSLGLILLVWLVFQVFTLPEVAPIQYVMFVVAAVLVALPLLPAMRRYFAE